MMIRRTQGATICIRIQMSPVLPKKKMVTTVITMVTSSARLYSFLVTHVIFS